MATSRTTTTPAGGSKEAACLAARAWGPEITRSTRRILALASALALVGCRERAPARLTGAYGDTLLVNAPEPTRLTVQSVDAQGHAARVRDAYWQAVGEVPFTLSADGTVHCTTAGDGTVDVSRGDTRARLVVRCRPLQSLRVRLPALLEVGGPPVAYVLEGVGPRGEAVDQLAGRVGVRDTSIVDLRDTLLLPRRRGVTSLHVALAHCELDKPLEVIERVRDPSALEASQLYEDTLTLVPEEIRSWTLRPNLYALGLVADSQAQPSLDFGMAGANCARSSYDVRALSCLNRAPAQVVVRHTGVASGPLRAVVRMRVSAMPHPDSSDARRRLAERNAARAGRGRLPSCPIAL